MLPTTKLSSEDCDSADAQINLPQGVQLRSLASHHDERGDLTEIFRAQWDTGMTPVQWNLVNSQAGVLRGVHLHLKHVDYLLMAAGRMLVGLRDLRRGSVTEGQTALVELNSAHQAALTIPPGVAHGFYFPEAALHFYAVSAYWDPTDELGCHWADAALEIPWPMTEAIVSPRDAGLPSLKDLFAATMSVPSN